jgi:hypothetical protein
MEVRFLTVRRSTLWRQAEAHLSKPLSTLLTIDVEEFDSYEARDEELITFSLKEFRAVNQLGVDINAALEAAFTSGGQWVSLGFALELRPASFPQTALDLSGSRLLTMQLRHCDLERRSRRTQKRRQTFRQEER